MSNPGVIPVIVGGHFVGLKNDLVMKMVGSREAREEGASSVGIYGPGFGASV